MDLAREPAIRLNGLEVRPSTREIVHAGGRLVVEPQVMAVLLTLARAGGEVVSREALQDACWDGRIVSDDAINRVISRVRKISELTQGQDFTLETITKVGYRLVTPAPEAMVEAPQSVHSASPKRWLGVVAGVVGALLLAAGAGWWMLRPEAQAAERPLTLAVLPFDDLGASGADEALALSMAREIRNTLSRVRGLRVVSDTSSFAAAAEPMSSIDMAKRLGADMLLDGSLARDGETLRISTELVDGWTGVNIWTGSGDGPASDLDRVRQTVSAAVFEQIVKKVGPKRVEMLAPARPGDPRAYALILQAEQELQSTVRLRMRGRAGETLDAGERANALIDQALAMEPENPLALRLKGQIVSMSATHELFAQNLSPADKQANAAVYYRRALVSDPDNVPALSALAEYYRRFEWRWDDATQLLQRAMALDPNYSEAHIYFSYLLSGEGRCLEALEHARLAIALDPEFGWRTLGVPRALKCLGRFEEADAAYLAALDHDRGNMFVLREMYLNLLVRRDVAGLQKLRAHVRDELWQGTPAGDIEGWLFWTQAALDALNGKPERFLSLVEADVTASERTVEGAPIPEQYRAKGDILWIQAVELAVAGQTERSLNRLEQAVKLGTLYIPETMPFGAYEFSPEVRADPRYAQLWGGDPRLRELVKMRRAAVKARQMHGVLDGKKVWPKAG